MSGGPQKNALPIAMPSREEADHARLNIPPGPWLEPQWAVLTEVGDIGRIPGTCDVDDCDRERHPSSPRDASLCYPHHTQWWRARRVEPIEVRDWLPSAKSPQQRVRSNSVTDRVIDFDQLPQLIAIEIRFVAGRKVSSGDWTPNRLLLDFLQMLTRVVDRAGVESLLDRRPEDWTLLLRQEATSAQGRNIAAYSRTFFSTLHRALVVNPWAEDRWLWKGGFEHLVHTSARTHNGQNILWGQISQPWIREPVKDYARTCLTTGRRAWSTVIQWARSLAQLSAFLEQEGIDDPLDLDRALFLDYLVFLNQSGASKHTLSGANIAAAVLSAVQDHVRDGRRPGDPDKPMFGSEVFLRHGENVVEKVREPKPYPADVVGRIDAEVLPDPLLEESARAMLQLTRWGGLRISELVTTPLDCLRHNGNDGYWVTYWMTKTKSWRRFPIPNDLAEMLLNQQSTVRDRFGDDTEFLFPSPQRSNERAGRVHPWSTSGFRSHVAASFIRNNITHSALTGERISGGSIHRYRHTIGTALLNSGWSQHEVSEFLGHDSETMTAAYAKILDATLVRKINEFHDDQPKPAAPGALVDPAVERMRAKFSYQLADGACTLPANQQCDIRDNPCADCAFYDPGGEALRPVHEDRRRRLKLHIEKATDPYEIALNEKALAHIEGVLGSSEEPS